MKTFHVAILGCKVNQYEGEQMARLLCDLGLQQVDQPELADLRVVHTCSVTVQAACKSRQNVRQAITVPVDEHFSPRSSDSGGQRVVVTGCWATSDRASIEKMPGVSAVLGHDADVAAELRNLVQLWQDGATQQNEHATTRCSGTFSLPQLDSRQNLHQRAFIKIQDGCDAHCAYCIIPKLRPKLWSRPADEVVEEARRMTAAGHRELVLTGIFLGAYGQPTALRRRLASSAARPLAQLVDALCTRVDGLKRLRLSSLEPGDLTDDLLDALKRHPQVVPHFHLPLQSGCDAILRRMNRQYTRDDYLRMIDRAQASFDRPAITTDIIVGFPLETDDAFAQTLDVVDRTRFIHIHAFPFSPRPGTAAARWTRQFIRGPVVNQRIDLLRQRSAAHSLTFRQQFLGAVVQVIVERPEDPASPLRHGRCERYFPIHFDAAGANPGDCVQVRITQVTTTHTHGVLIC